MPKLSVGQKLAINYYRAKLNLLNVINGNWAAGHALDLFTRPYARTRMKDPPVWKLATRLHFQSQGIQIAGYCWKAKEPAGKRLLIVHGFAGNARKFDRYIKPALALGYDVYAFDAPAHGKSGGRRLNGITYTQTLVDIIKYYGAFEAYLAHSLGGLCLVLSLHELKVEKTEKIVLVAPATESSTAADNFFGFLQLPEDLRKKFEEKVEAMAGLPLSWYSISRVLHEIKGDILWLHDELDTTTPFKDVQPLIKKAYAHVQFYITQGLGHSRIYIENKVKKRIVAFLAGEDNTGDDPN